MTPINDPLFHAILSGLLASGMHPDNAMPRALSMYTYLRDTQAPERPPYAAYITLGIGVIVFILGAYLITCHI